MKTLTTLLLLILFTGLSNAQTTKPTIEETVQYIKNELQGKEIVFADYTRGPYSGDIYRTRHYMYSKFSNFKMANCRLIFTYSWMNTRIQNGVVTKIHESSRASEFVLNFSRVEEISPQNVSDHLFHISFTEKNTDGTLKKEKYFIGSEAGSTYESIYSSKLYKAFQHLRKLCDAPEPISFD